MTSKLRSPLLIASQIAIFSHGSSAWAATSTWIGTNNAANNFNTPANWNTGGSAIVPVPTDVVIIGSGATVNSTTTFNRSANTTLDGSLIVSNSGHFNIGSANNPTFTVGTTGNFTYAPTAAGSQYLLGSVAGLATFTQLGGTVNVTVNRGVQVSDGTGAGRTGTFNINGGTFGLTIAASGATGGDAIAEIYGGFLAGRAGGAIPDSFNVAGGTATISAPNSPTRRFTLTNGASANVSSGSLAVNSFAEHRLGYDDANIVGASGAPANAAASKVTVSGTGSLTFAMGGTTPYFDIGATPGYNGAIEVSGTGTFNISGGGLSIGSGGANGNVTLTSGSMTVNQFINIGRKDSNTAGGTDVHLTLNGGTLSTSSIRSGGGVPSATNNNIISNGGTIKALANEADFLRIGVNGTTSLNTLRPYLKIEGGGLTFDTNGYNVGIQAGLHAGTTSGGGLTKIGNGTLSLSGTSDYTGTTLVSAGTLKGTTGKALSGPCTIATGATLTVDGSLSDSWTVTDLTLSNGSTLSIQSLVLGYSNPQINATGTLITGGIITVVIPEGFAVGDYPLIGHSGAIAGDGISAFQLAPQLRGVQAEIIDVDNTVTLRVTAVDSLVWKGNTDSTWDINSTANWTLAGNSDKYFENDVVAFDDSATSTAVTLDVTVAPKSVTFENSSKDYTLSGSGAIGGSGPVTKFNAGNVTLAAAITTTGITHVEDGTLTLGNGVINGSITGPLVNDGDVAFNPAGTATHAGALGGNSDGIFTKIGTGTQIITSVANTSAGKFVVNQGTLQFGNGTTNGEMGTAATYEVASGAALRLDRTVTLTPPWARITGAGTLALNSAQPVNGSANWGNSLALTAGFTGTLRVERGRVGADLGRSTLGGTSKIEILNGAQFLAFTSANAYTTPIEIAGSGSGDVGFPGGLRLAAGATATWGGSVTLTADSGIMVQRGSTFTVTGAITGAYLCEFYAAESATETSNLIVAPTVPGQNTYTSTRITGNPTASVIAGTTQAFSTGPLVVDNAILKLNGHSHTFASLGGAGGAIGNYHASTPVTLTIGSGSVADTSYAGVLRNGGAAPLALTKTGIGKLTLTAALAYTGATTVEQGTLALSTASLDNNATVTIKNGAKLELNTGTSDTVGSLVLENTAVLPGTYSALHPTYGAYFAGDGSIVVGGAFEAWASLKGLDGTPGKENGLADDPDKDGMDNLTEFYLDGNPLANDPSILPAGSLDVDYLKLTFHRRNDAEATVATQAVQYGTDLSGWTDAPLTAGNSTTPAGVIVEVAETSAVIDTITVKIPRTLAPSGKLFGRLHVTK